MISYTAYPQHEMNRYALTVAYEKCGSINSANTKYLKITFRWAWCPLSGKEFSACSIPKIPTVSVVQTAKTMHHRSRLSEGRCVENMPKNDHRKGSPWEMVAKLAGTGNASIGSCTSARHLLIKGCQHSLVEVGIGQRMATSDLWR